MSVARLIYRHYQVFDDGAIIEAVIWDVPRAVPGSSHLYKYRLFYGYPGQRVIGYDNERSKGDHRHFRDTEESYNFTTPEQLIDDFLADVENERRMP